MSRAVINYFLAWRYVGPQGQSKYRSEISKLKIQEQHEFGYLFKKKKKEAIQQTILLFLICYYKADGWVIKPDKHKNIIYADPNQTHHSPEHPRAFHTDSGTLFVFI